LDIQSQLKEGIIPECFNMIKIAFPLTKQADIGFGYIAIGAAAISGNPRQFIGI
jgi:hypothetical protein